jgi:alpha-L-fucosidase
MARYGESIYGTRGGPLAAADWGVTTQKGDKVYLHVLHWQGKLLALPPMKAAVRSARRLADGTAVGFTQNADGVVLTLPENKERKVDEVIVLTVAK